MPRKRRRRRNPPGSTTARGYGSQHKQLRDQLLADLAARPGQPCPQTFPDGTRCGRPMHPGQELHLGHTSDRTGYIGLVHAYCNLRAAGMLRNLRAAKRRRRHSAARQIQAAGQIQSGGDDQRGPALATPRGRRPW